MRALGFLFLLATGVAVLGLSLDWFSLSSETRAKEKVFTLSVDPDKIEADTKAAARKIKEKARDLIEEVRDSGGEAVTGTISGVAETSFTVLEDDGTAVTFLFADEVTIEIDDVLSTPADLAVGDTVAVIDEGADSKADRIVASR